MTWIARYPSPSLVEEARARRAARDANGVPSLFREDDDVRWIGDLAELEFAAWLTEQGIPHVHGGGVDQDADFMLDGIGVGLKARTVTRDFKPHYVVNVHDAHKGRTSEQVLFFAAYEREAERLLLLGAKARGKFFDEAHFTDRDDPLHHARIGASATWNLRADALNQPDYFLRWARMRAAA